LNITRRRFLSNVAGVSLGLSLTSRRAKAVSPNEKIVVAHVGVGGMGTAHLQWFAAFPDVDVAAVCDVDSARAEAALEALKKMRPDTKAVAVTDFCRILERKDVDAVTQATPDHWHALVAVLAFQAGKHVYGEKPLSYSLHEAQVMRESRRKHNRVFQLGTQIHAGDNYHRVVELVRSGALGKIHTVRVWKVGGDTMRKVPPDADPPPTLNWDLWLGPAPQRRFNPAIAPYNFRYFWDYAGGVFTDFWCHIADVVFWALDLGAPKTVEATGDDLAQYTVTTPPFMDAEFEFDDLKMTWHSRVPDVKGAKGRGIGAQFVGTKGELVTDYGSRVIFLDGKELNDLPDVPQSLPRSPGHQRNFLDCIKSGDAPESNLDYVYRMTLPMFMACLFYRLGRKLKWDDARSEFVGDAEANRMKQRPYRSPWSLSA
jgi:predicted dehydrogenase